MHRLKKERKNEDAPVPWAQANNSKIYIFSFDFSQTSIPKFLPACQTLSLEN